MIISYDEFRGYKKVIEGYKPNQSEAERKKYIQAVKVLDIMQRNEPLIHKFYEAQYKE